MSEPLFFWDHTVNRAEALIRLAYWIEQTEWYTGTELRFALGNASTLVKLLQTRESR